MFFSERKKDTRNTIFLNNSGVPDRGFRKKLGELNQSSGECRICTVCEHSCCGKLCLGIGNVFFIGWATARQVINMVPAGLEPTFIFQCSALTTRILPVPDILVPRTINKTRGIFLSKQQQAAVSIHHQTQNGRWTKRNHKKLFSGLHTQISARKLKCQTTLAQTTKQCEKRSMPQVLDVWNAVTGHVK